MKQKRLFTCYFLYHTLLGIHRIVAIYHDEGIIIDEMQINEQIIYYVTFTEDFADGCLLPLIDTFGKDNTAEFFRHLLERGFTTAKEGYAQHYIDPDFCYIMDYAFTKDHRRIYYYLRNIYDKNFIEQLTAYTMCEGINSLSHIESEQLWGINYLQ